MKNCLFFLFFIISLTGSAQTIDQVKKFKSSGPAPAPTSGNTQANPTSIPDDDTMEEYRKIRNANSREAEALNQMLKNRQGKEPEQGQESLQNFNFLLNPKVQKLGGFLTNKKNVEALNAFIDQKNMKNMLRGQIILILAFFIIRAWLSPKTKTFTASLVASMWITGFYIFASLFLLPKLIYGPVYFEFIKGAITLTKELIG